VETGNGTHHGRHAEVKNVHGTAQGVEAAVRDRSVERVKGLHLQVRRAAAVLCAALPPEVATVVTMPAKAARAAGAPTVRSVGAAVAKGPPEEVVVHRLPEQPEVKMPLAARAAEVPGSLP